MRERIPSEFDDDGVDEENVEKLNSENKICEIFNQKNYIEELNKKQEVQLEYLNRRLSVIEKSNSELSDETTAFKLENEELKAKLTSIESERSKLDEEYKLKYEALINDHMVERETFLNSKSGLVSIINYKLRIY